MARVANVEIPNQKRSEISLTYIYGIGRNLAKEILTKVNVNPDKKVADWTDEEAASIRQIIRESYTVEGELKRQIRNNKDRLNYIGCLRGIRHRLGLPVRGQNTKNNARTRKGKKKTVAGKKKATK